MNKMKAAICFALGSLICAGCCHCPDCPVADPSKPPHAGILGFAYKTCTGASDCTQAALDASGVGSQCVSPKAACEGGFCRAYLGSQECNVGQVTTCKKADGTTGHTTCVTTAVGVTPVTCGWSGPCS